MTPSDTSDSVRRVFRTLGPPVVELTMTCGSCPNQWEGKLADGQTVYVRNRHGRLSIGFGSDLHEAVTTRQVIYTDPSDPDIDLAEMLQLTGLRVSPDCDLSRADMKWAFGEGLEAE